MKTINIDGVIYHEALTVENSEYVMIRTYSSGVHFGVLKSREGREITLLDARRVFSWSGANTLNELSQTGPSSAKISKPVNEILLLESIEVIPMSKDAVKKMKEMQWN